MKILTVQNVLLAIIAGVLVYSVFFAAHVLGASTAGSTFNSAKYAGITINAVNAAANGTSTSVLNTDSQDRYVTGFRIGCNGVGSSQTAYTGAGLANWQISIGTTSTAAPATPNPFAAITKNFTLGTTTTNLVVASSTLQTATSSLAMEWPANTYMTFWLNATNTATCTVGVDYIGS